MPSISRNILGALTSVSLIVRLREYHSAARAPSVKRQFRTTNPSTCQNGYLPSKRQSTASMSEHSLSADSPAVWLRAPCAGRARRTAGVRLRRWRFLSASFLFFSLNLHGRISAVDGYCLARNVARLRGCKAIRRLLLPLRHVGFCSLLFSGVSRRCLSMRTLSEPGMLRLRFRCRRCARFGSGRCSSTRFCRIWPHCPTDIDRDVARCRGAAACDLGGR